MERVVLDFQTNAHEFVAVYRHKPYDSSWVGFTVTQDRSPAPPAFSTFNSWIYQSSDHGGHWKVEFETDAPQWVEVIAFPR